MNSLGPSPASHETQPSAPERILEVPESPPASELRLGVGGDGERGKTKAGGTARTRLGGSQSGSGKDDSRSSSFFNRTCWYIFQRSLAFG